MKSKYVYHRMLLALAGLSTFAQAASLGEAAEAALEPLGFVSSVVHKICFVIGIMLIVGSFLKYKRYRDNPIATPLSTVVFMLVFGVIIVLLPLIPAWLTGRWY